MTIKVGQTLETAMWLDGEESQQMLNHYKGQIAEFFDELCQLHKVVRGPIRWIEKHPGTDRVPVVPDHIQGQRVRLLVAEADVVAQAPVERPESFIANLDLVDLRRLRWMTRAAHRKHYPHNPLLTESQCDEIIEACGPEAAIDALRKHTLQ